MWSQAPKSIFVDCGFSMSRHCLFAQASNLASVVVTPLPRAPMCCLPKLPRSLAAGIFWSIDIGWRLVTGQSLVGGTDYMWDTRVPLWARLLSSFHIGLPVALLWAVRKIGYDRRALALQAPIAAGLFVVSRFLRSEEHTSELQSPCNLVCRLLLEKKKN